MKRNKLPTRKHPRLKGYDYSQNGAYFITMCVKDRRKLLGKIVVAAVVGRGIPDTPSSYDTPYVENDTPSSYDTPDMENDTPSSYDTPDMEINTPYVELSEYGKNLEETIEFINNKENGIYINKYVIMPNHVHMIVIIHDLRDGGASEPNENGASTNGEGVCATNGDGASGMPRPTNPNDTIPKIVSSIKRFTNKQSRFDLWQTSYHDHIIRNEDDYLRIWKYIDENPAKWMEDKYY